MTNEFAMQLANEDILDILLKVIEDYNETYCKSCPKIPPINKVVVTQNDGGLFVETYLDNLHFNDFVMDDFNLYCNGRVPNFSLSAVDFSKCYTRLMALKFRERYINALFNYRVDMAVKEVNGLLDNIKPQR